MPVLNGRRGQIHAKDGITASVRRRRRRCLPARPKELHVDTFRTKEFLGAVYRQPLNLINEWQPP